MFWYKYHFDPPTNSFSCSLSIIWWERKGSWNVILVYKAYLYRSYVSQTEDCRPGCSAAEGSCTHCTVTMLQPSPHVTCHTCLPTPWSPGPVIVADTRRSCSCGAFCLADSLCHALLSRVPRVGSRSRVTCHVSHWRGWGSITVTRSPHPRWLLAHVRSLVARCSLCSGQWSPPRTASLLRLGQVSCRSACVRGGWRLPSGGGAGC